LSFKDDDIKLQLNYITRRLYILEEEDAHLNKRLSGIEEENEALKAGNAHLNKRLSSIEDENVALKAENADLNKRLSQSRSNMFKSIINRNHSFCLFFQCVG
jgi:regulator of replication initiation timing